MARYSSGDQQNLQVGISSFSEDKTSLVVIGKIGINTSDAMEELHVEGSAFISGSIGIGTSVPGDPVQINNTTKIAVGVVTANEIYGELKGPTGVVTTATNIAGLSTGQLLVQTAENTTSFFDYGNTGQVLASRGDNQTPQWVNAAPGGAIEGILLFDEGSPVGLGTTFGGIDFRGPGLAVTGHTGFNIATVISTATGFWEQNTAGINTTSNVGIGTTNPLNAFQVGAATSSFTVVSTASTVMVGIGTTDPSFTLDVRGDANVDGSLSVNGNSVPSLAMVVALGGF